MFRCALGPVLATVLTLTSPAAAEPLHDAVDAYALYQIDASEILGLTAIEDIDAALERAARHDPARVSRGWIAYGAMTAAQSPAFARGVQSRVRAAGRAPVLRQLRRDLAYARRRPPGSDEAIQLILNASAADRARLNAASVLYRANADRMEVSAPDFNTAEIRQARNARLRALAAATRALDPAFAPRLHVSALSQTPLANADAFGGAHFWSALTQRPSPAFAASTRTETQRYAATTNRMLTLAALFILDATSTEPQRVAAMLDDAPSRECLEMQLLQLRQCASVANYANEDAHCIARHGLAGPGACFGALTP